MYFFRIFFQKKKEIGGGDSDSLIFGGILIQNSRLKQASNRRKCNLDTNKNPTAAGQKTAKSVEILISILGTIFRRKTNKKNTGSKRYCLCYVYVMLCELRVSQSSGVWSGLCWIDPDILALVKRAQLIADK